MRLTQAGHILAAQLDGGAAAALPGKLCRACAVAVAVTGVGISVVTEAGQRSMAATDGVAERLEAVQFSLGEGPCIDAVRHGRPVLVANLAGAAVARWPSFGRELLDGGIGAVFAFPLQVGSIRLGTLALYRRRAGELDDTRLAAALAYADAATAVLLGLHSEHPDVAGDESAAALFDPVRDHPEVHQATGRVSVQAGSGLGEALVLLRARAYADGRTVLDIARDVLAGRVRFDANESHHG